MGATHIVLAEATPQLMQKALQLAWSLRVEKNDRPRPKRGRGKP